MVDAFMSELKKLCVDCKFVSRTKYQSKNEFICLRETFDRKDIEYHDFVVGTIKYKDDYRVHYCYKERSQDLYGCTTAGVFWKPNLRFRLKSFLRIFLGRKNV